MATGLRFLKFVIGHLRQSQLAYCKTLKSTRPSWTFEPRPKWPIINFIILSAILVQCNALHLMFSILLNMTHIFEYTNKQDHHTKSENELTWQLINITWEGLALSVVAYKCHALHISTSGNSFIHFIPCSFIIPGRQTEIVISG